MTEVARNAPDISVVVAIVDGHEALRNCLTALTNQEGTHNIEIIVPYDHISTEAATMRAEFPDCRFLDLGVVLNGMEPRNALELHRFWDIRQAEGIKSAHGRLVGLVTDRGIPDRTWVQTMVSLHKETGGAAVGGCIDNGVDKIWNWAVHVSDFGRYTAPIPTQESDFLSATNVCYEGDKLRAFRSHYERRFYEPSLHAALQASGERLFLSDRVRTTEYRPRIPTRNLLGEWFQWGRKYGRIRSGEVNETHRILRACATPILPFVLYWRHLRTQLRKRAHFRQFCLASPLIFLIMSMWALGELVGYVEGARAEAM